MGGTIGRLCPWASIKDVTYIKVVAAAMKGHLHGVSWSPEALKKTSPKGVKASMGTKGRNRKMPHCS